MTFSSGRASRPWRPGVDQRAVRHPAAGGRSRTASDAGPVVVVGGGVAGLAAATGLAERGTRVVLVEPEAELGGRVRAWRLDGGRSMSRGFHAFFRQYYNLRALLRRADPGLDHLVPIRDYPLVMADGPQDSFTGIPRTPPLNLATFVLKSPSFSLRDLTRVDAGAAMELLDVAFPATFSHYDGESASHFLDRLRFPELARHLALEVFARSFFADPDDFAAGELVAMFHAYFLGSSEGLLFDVPDDDYETTLWGPMRRHLEGLGVEVRTGTSVTAVDLSGRGAALVGLSSGEELRAAAVVLAADPVTARGLLLSAGVDDPAWLARVAAQRLAPPFAVWRLWLDRHAAAERPPFLGTSGYGPVDNVSLLERFEDGARTWSDAHGGSVVELHAYALPHEDGEVDEAALQARMRAELSRIYPELADAQPRHAEWVLRRDCPLAAPTPWAERLTVSTPDRRLVLAGDGIRCDLPVALMERAATTGFLAANQLLADAGVRGHDLWSVPMQARNRVSAPLHRLLVRAG